MPAAPPAVQNLVQAPRGILGGKRTSLRRAPIQRRARVVAPAASSSTSASAQVVRLPDGGSRRRVRASVAPASSSSASTSAQVITTPDGGTLEVLSAGSADASSLPPLLFIHGSAHAAWCWAERWQPWFASRGWASHAVSLRGRGGSGPPPPGAKAGGSLASHASDVAAVIAAVCPPTSPPPVVVGHSFGGLVAQRLAGPGPPTIPLSGLILAASVPPSGNGPMIKRIASDQGLWASAVLTADFIFKTYRKNPKAARRLFFSDAMPEAEVERLMKILAAQDGDTPVIDVRSINSELPVAPPSPPLPSLVLGGGADRIVDVGGLRESAEAVGAGEPVVLEGVAHDLMLDDGWEAGAAAVEAWLVGRFC